MFLIIFRARIRSKSAAAEEFADVGGAYVQCYIQFKSFEVAEKLAKLLIREQGWIPGKRTDAVRILKKELKTKDEKQLYAEALKFGYSLAFYMWPKDAVDAEDNDEYEEVKKGR